MRRYAKTRYLEIVLTVIALNLTLLVLRELGLVSELSAQAEKETSSVHVESISPQAIQDLRQTLLLNALPVRLQEVDTWPVQQLRDAPWPVRVENEVKVRRR